MTASPSQRYTSTAVMLHWLHAVMIACNFSVGLAMHELPFSVRQVQLYNWHKWAGITALLLAGVRLLWRWRHPPPALPAHMIQRMPVWQHAAHRCTHGLLYVLFFGVPLSGWAYSSAAGFPVVWFRVLPLPDFVEPDRTLANALKALHGWLNLALAALVGLHAVAALKHHWIDRDGLMNRMRFGRR